MIEEPKIPEISDAYVIWHEDAGYFVSIGMFTKNLALATFYPFKSTAVDTMENSDKGRYLTPFLRQSKVRKIVVCLDD